MKHLAPLLRTKGRKDRPISVAATLSARVGSISDNNFEDGIPIESQRLH